MKHRFSVLALILVLVIGAAMAVASCGDEDNGGDLINKPGLQSKYTTTKKVTTTRGTGVAVGPGDTPGVTNTFDIASSSLRMIPAKVESDDPNVAVGGVLASNRGMSITGVGEGSTSLTVYDDFGNTMRISIDVGADKTVTCKPFSPFIKDKSLNVVFDCGAVANDDNPDTDAIQAAIDRLTETGGGTVYIPRGVYDTGLLQLKENVHLVLAGQVEDATVGYTDEVKAAVDGGQFAVLRALDHDMFHNLKAGSKGTTGIDNYSITGGVMDMRGSSRCILIVCADNVQITNSIFKDCLNDHAIQVTGSTNVTLRNIMFAGYNSGSNTSTGEEVQIEAGCEGATGGGIARFGDGEYYSSENVIIDRCYFGPSDKYGPQTIAIGHHGARDESDCDGLTISNCVFENSRIYSIKTFSYSNVKILNNRFTSEGDNRARGGVQSFIYCQVVNWDVVAKQLHPVSGFSENAVLAYARSMEGSQNIQISGNTFIMNGSKAVRRIIAADSHEIYVGKLGADTVHNIVKYTTFGNYSKIYSGYNLIRNSIYNMVVTNNRVNVNCTESEFDDHLFEFNHINGLTYSGNTVTTSLSFTNSYEGNSGVLVNNCIVGNEMYTRSIEMASFSDTSIVIVLPNKADGSTVNLTANGNRKLVLKSDGRGEIMLDTADNGSLIVTFKPQTGYKFTGWTVESTGEEFSFNGNTKITADMTLVANFSR